jgi:LuxR family transcriptional regulator, maltose regulon positive regulatory protein
LASEADPHHEVASRLIERGVRGAWSRGEGPTVLGWLEALPEEAKRSRPRLLLQHAQALVLTGRPHEAEPLLREAERAASEASTEKSSRFLMGFASAVRSWRARLRGDASEAVELARRALSLLPAEEAYLRNFAAVCLGDALWITGDLAAAGAAYAEATEIGRAAGHIYGTLNAMALRARVQAERGRLREAEKAFREVSRFVIEQGIGRLPAAGLVHIGMADITYERDDIDAAERELEMGIGLTERTREVGELVRGYVTLSKVKLARGDEEGAFEAAREAEQVARTSGANLQISIAAAWTARLHIARGDLDETAALEQERATNAASGASQTVDRLTSARLLHARGRHDEALRLLRELREAAEAAGRIGTVIEIISLQALALWDSNEKEQGVGTLTQALAMAEPEGFVRTFVDEGPAMSELLSEVLQARQRGHLDATGRVSTQYLAKLLAVLAQGASANGANARLAEPVSERELEVLALIAAGETNGEIAGKLFVSISTVKTHINNLYRKLGARSRTQAVARARELGLL